MIQIACTFNNTFACKDVFYEHLTTFLHQVDIAVPLLRVLVAIRLVVTNN